MGKEKKEQTLYEILGVSPTATLREIKIAYRKKAMEYHPDVNDKENVEECHAMMCKINDAYSILRNIDSRKLYDGILKSSGQYPDSKIKGEKEKPTNTESEKTTSTYERIDSSDEAIYVYYDYFDFDELEQQEFISWMEEFFDMFMRFIFDYYKGEATNKMDYLGKLYSRFDNIIVYEKKLSKNEQKFNYK